jgi:cysteine synthase
VAARMSGRGEKGSIVTLLSDRGERYVHSYYDAGWLASHGFDVASARETVRAAAEEGKSLPPLAACTAEERYQHTAHSTQQ